MTSFIDHAEHAARIALALAGVDAAAQRRVLDDLPHRLDRVEAEARRNRAICEAHRLIGATPGSVKILAKALSEFQARAWPQMRHLSEPPPDATPLRRAYFLACQAADDSGMGIPGERQIRRICDMAAFQCQSGAA